jgi:hypothetical protein
MLDGHVSLPVELEDQPERRKDHRSAAGLVYLSKQPQL